MADLKISQLAAAASLAGNEVFPIEVAGSTFACSTSTFSPADTALTWASSLTWNLDSNPIASVVLGGNTTITITGGRPGSSYRLACRQGGTGSRTIAIEGAIVLGTPAYSTAGGASNIITVDYVNDPGPVTLNAGDTNTTLALSNANLTATVPTGAATNTYITRSLFPQSASKLYVESTHGAYVSPLISNRFGLSSTAQVLTGYVGDGANNSIGWAGDGSVNINNASVATIGAYGANSQIAQAVDLNANLWWGRVGAGNWNNSGTANPATGVGGISIGGIASAVPFCAAWHLFTAGDVVTMNFGASGFAQAVPAGYVAWPSATRFVVVA